MQSAASSFQPPQKEKVAAPTSSPTKEKDLFHKNFVLAEVELAREADLGVNDDRFVVKTHLGSIIREGDIVLGIMLSSIKWK